MFVGFCPDLVVSCITRLHSELDIYCVFFSLLGNKKTPTNYNYKSSSIKSFLALLPRILNAKQMSVLAFYKYAWKIKSLW